MNDMTIPEVTVFRDLSVLIPRNLTFREHVNEVIRSASNVCNLILRNFVIRRPDFYTQLFRSIADRASPVAALSSCQA